MRVPVSFPVFSLPFISAAETKIYSEMSMAERLAKVTFTYIYG